MLVSNPFLSCETKKSNFQWLRVNTHNLKNYSLKCSKVLFGCDEIKAISQDDGLQAAPCFQISNDTNSKEKFVYDPSYFTQNIFSGISIVRNNFDSFDMYSVIVVYEGGDPFSLIDFKFYKPGSRIVEQNHYKSDITIHGKAFRISCIEEFDILTFIQELLFYQLDDQNSILTMGVLGDKLLVALGEYYITRYDFRFDFFHENGVKHLKFSDVFSPNSKIKNRNENQLIRDRKSGKLYSGRDAGSRKNHYVYVRMYQKQIEILDKGLDDLYVDYLNYNGKVWRLEFEFGSDFTVKARGKHYLIDEFVNHKLQDMAFEYVGIKTPEGGFSSPKSYKPKFIDRSLPSKTRALSMFWSIGKSLYDSDLDPHFYLDLGLLKKGIDYSSIQELRKIYDKNTENDMKLLNYKFEDMKIERKNRYENIFKNQLGIDL